MIFLSISEGGYSHLFAYQPLSLPFTRLTDGEWDDITPALSPNGEYLAFASNRAGPWDLYLMHLSSGELTRLTDSPAYDASPSWSPDGQFIVYESYFAGSASPTANLELLLQPVFDPGEPIPLSDHPAADFSPTWSPKGRQIAFISDRSGERDVWLADLDRVGADRFINLSLSPTSREAHPAWSPDGERLAWASQEDGAHNLYTWDQAAGRQYLGSGDWPAWSPAGDALFTALSEPNLTYLTAYNFSEPVLAYPPLAMPGEINGLAWSATTLPEPLPGALAEAARSTPTPDWQAALTSVDGIPADRQHLVPLEGIQAPYPQLHDLVDEAFHALRQRVGLEAGWDFLSVLENAFVPLTAPLPPGMGKDWLYSGRGIAFNPSPLNAGWIAILPEQFGSETYWRVYLQARYQDGSQGTPFFDRPWDFAARYLGDPITYEQGGALAAQIPPGYWIDFTALARAYNWQRLPALSTWRSAYPAARFNEFVHLEGQDWRTAMLELYPPEALLTPTVPAPPTLTPTPTPRWTASP
jgi:TolB protein